MAQHAAAIRSANDRHKGVTVFAGIEVDIFKDGSLDFDAARGRQAFWSVCDALLQQSQCELQHQDRAVDHIDYICQLAGDSQHVAIGSDLDGGVGTDEFPADLDTIADLQRFNERLADRGYKPDAIADILHNNWIDFLRKSWSSDN